MHITLEFQGIKPVFKVPAKEDYVKAIQEELETIKFNQDEFEEQIVNVLKRARQCDFVIFSYGHKFLQFGLKSGEYILDYPMPPTGYMDEHKYQVLGLLAELGFHSSERGVNEFRILWLYPNSIYKYNISKDEKMKEIITANFRHNSELAGKFVASVYKDFFKESPTEMEITVG